MAQINLAATTASLIPAAPLGYVTLYANENKLPQLKDNSGSVLTAILMNVETASLAQSASLVTSVTSASYGLSGSYALTASFSLKANSASRADFTYYAQTASTVTSADYVQTVSSSNLAFTASGYSGNVNALNTVLFPDEKTSATFFGRAFGYGNRILRAGLYGGTGNTRIGAYGSTSTIGATTDYPVVSRPPGSFTKVYTNVNNIFALGSNGVLYAAGYNAEGQLATGDTTNRITLEPITHGALSGSGIQVLDFWATNANDNANAATISVFAKVNNNGTIKYYSWGGNSSGQLGIGSTINQSIPINIAAFDGLQVTFTVGIYRTFALRSTGAVSAAGINFYGELGVGDTTNRTSFTACVDSNSAAITNAAEVYFTIGSNAGGSTLGATSYIRTSTGAVLGAGNNTYYNIGINNTTQQTRFTNVTNTTTANLSNIVSFKAGRWNTLGALDSSGNLWAWGVNTNGWMGDGTAEGANVTRAKIIETNVTNFWPTSTSRGTTLGRALWLNKTENGRPVTYASGAQTLSNSRLGVSWSSTNVNIRQRVMFSQTNEYAADIYAGGKEDDSGNPYYFTIFKTNNSRLYIVGSLGSSGAALPFFSNGTTSNVVAPINFSDLPL